MRDQPCYGYTVREIISEPRSAGTKLDGTATPAWEADSDQAAGKLARHTRRRATHRLVVTSAGEGGVMPAAQGPCTMHYFWHGSTGAENSSTFSTQSHPPPFILGDC